MTLSLPTSARRIDCQVLAEELAPLEVAWTATDPHAGTPAKCYL